jgi:hypothetical protein
MPVHDFEDIISQIKTNCNISDAHFWGNYSICGLLMRFRELFRNEKNMMPWEQISHKEITDWIAAKENLWQELENENLNNIMIKGRSYDPFDVDDINSALLQGNLVYGAGYGPYMKPSFFVGELLYKEARQKLHILISGDEFARDLSAYPAMLQDARIFARKDVLVTIMWDKFEEFKAKKGSRALAFAFSQYNVCPDDYSTDDIHDRIYAICQQELETYIHHELGEAFEGERLGSEWKHLLCAVRDRKVEFFLRGIKDVLSDTSEQGLLKHIIENDKKASLGFYISSISGFSKLLFPEILNVFDDFAVTRDWSRIDKARNTVHERTDALASKALVLYHREINQGTIDEILDKELLSSIPKK